MEKKKYTALVLQGGGALGAYEYGAVKALYENKNISPDVITGVSIGAISAAVLTGAKDGPVEGLRQLWDRLMVPDMPVIPDPLHQMFSLSFNPGMYTLDMKSLLNPFTATSVCDMAPLYSTLEALIDKNKLNSKTSPCLAVTATNILTGLIDEFDNRAPNGIDFKHIVASGSLPPFFPMTEIDGALYWDGGIFSNTPLGPAINRLEQLGDDDAEREIIIIELFPQSGAIPVNMLEVENRRTQIMYESKINYDSHLFDKINGYIDMIHQIELALPGNSTVRQLPSFKKLMGYKKIHKLTVIRPSISLAAAGGRDFTRKSIEQRIEQGFKDADQQYP